MKPWELSSPMPAAGLIESGVEQTKQKVAPSTIHGCHWMPSAYTQNPPCVGAPLTYCFPQNYESLQQQPTFLIPGLKPPSCNDQRLSRNSHQANEHRSPYYAPPLHQQSHVYLRPGSNKAMMSSPIALWPSSSLKTQLPCSPTKNVPLPMQYLIHPCWPNGYTPFHHPAVNVDTQRLQAKGGTQNGSLRAQSHSEKRLARSSDKVTTSASAGNSLRMEGQLSRFSDNQEQGNGFRGHGLSDIRAETLGFRLGDYGSSACFSAIPREVNSENSIAQKSVRLDCIEGKGKGSVQLSLQPTNATIETPDFSMSGIPEQRRGAPHIPPSDLGKGEKRRRDSVQPSTCLVGGCDAPVHDPRFDHLFLLENGALNSNSTEEPKSEQKHPRAESGSNCSIVMPHSECPRQPRSYLARSASATSILSKSVASEAFLETDTGSKTQCRTSSREKASCIKLEKRMVSDSCRSLTSFKISGPANRRMHDNATLDWFHPSKKQGTSSLDSAADSSTVCGIDDDTVLEASRSVSSGESTSHDVKEAVYSVNLVCSQDHEDAGDNSRVIAEPYIKILVPGYIRWKEKQMQVGLLPRESPEGLTYDEVIPCVWADDCIITTSKEAMGCEIVVNTKQCRYERPLINTCVERLGWIRDDQTSNKGNIVWLGGSVPDHDHLHFMRNMQIVNRFPGMWDMTKKRMLAKVLDLYRMLYPDFFDFSPPCWSFPEDCEQIEKILHSKNQDTYIIKPDGGAMGSGVQLVSRFRDIDAVILRGDGNYIMQKYIDNPRLLNRRKFDLRIYAALYSVGIRPKVFISKLGMARFCTEEYRPPTRRNLDNAFMHLTNYSINKDNCSSFLRSSDIHDTSNSKRLLKDVFEELKAEGVDVQNVWRQIKDITAKTFVCLQPWLNLRYRQVYRGTRTSDPSRCFQFLGLDILLDAEGKCWLLEVNSNPSLRIDYFDSQYEGIDIQLESTMDRAIKEPAVSEALAIASKLLLRPGIKKPQQFKALAGKPVVSTCNSVRSEINGVKRRESSTAPPKHGNGPVVSKGKAKSRQLGKKEAHSSIIQQHTQCPGIVSAYNQQKCCNDTDEILGNGFSVSNSAGAYVWSELNQKTNTGATGSLLASQQSYASSRRAQSAPAPLSRSPMPRIKRSASYCGSSFEADDNRRGIRAQDSGHSALANASSLPDSVKSLGYYPADACSKLCFSSPISSNAGSELMLLAMNGSRQGDESDSQDDGRGCASADAEIMISAYKEMQKCMECLNVLGLRFQVSQTPGSKEISTRHAAATPGCGDSYQEDLQRSKSRKALSRARPTGPYRPFLKKDRVTSKKGSGVLKGSYTKLHKDILKPMHGEQLRPQGCWTSLDPLVLSITAETALVRRLQLLFERLVDFPNKFGLERSRWIEICEIVKIGDILRKVSVPAIHPSRGARVPPALGHYSFRPPHRPVPLQRKAYSSGTFRRSASAAALQCEADGSENMNTFTVPGVLCGVRKRRLAIADMETLWLHEVQRMRRQIQLSDCVRGLGLLEVASMMTYLAVLCYPFLPQKAALVSMFLPESGSSKGAVLEQVVRQLEREEELGMPLKTSTKTPPPSFSTPCEPDDVQHDFVESSSAPRGRASAKSSPGHPACGKQKPNRQMLVVDSTDAVSSTDEMTRHRQHSDSFTIGGSEAHVECSDSKVPQLEARPATEAEEIVVNLKRLIGEDLGHLSVLDANCTKLREHISDIKGQLQKHIEQRASLLRRKGVTPLPSLKIASMQQVFGSRDLFASDSSEEASQNIEEKISACKHSLQSANSELEQTLRVRDQTAHRLEQHESQLQHCIHQCQTQVSQKKPVYCLNEGVDQGKAPRSLTGEVGAAKRSEAPLAPRVSARASNDGSAKQLRSISSERRNQCRAVPTADKLPEWHDVVCSSWPDLNSAVLELVPCSAKYEAFKRLIDFFELRLDLFYSNVLRKSRDVKPWDRH